MSSNDIAWCKLISCLIVLLTRLIVIVDTTEPRTTSTSRQMCMKLQSMLSFGKYQTSQISSNVSYTSRFYDQNFLAYSSVDDLLIFIEPKHQIHVYNAQTIQLLVNLTTEDVVIATSTTSLTSNSRPEIYFIYENHSETNLISLRVCQVRFNMFQFIFENIFCIETIHIQYDQPNLRINGLTIKRDHAGTKKSLLFISTEIGIVYSIFDTRLGSLIGKSTIMNETLNEGSIVLSSSGMIYYASIQEHLIYELHIQKDFRLRHGKIIKTNAIKYPFGLITDECNHLYIATRSMILIMYVQNRATIRSVFSKASDLPIIIERLNSTTYVYGTIRKNSAKSASQWMFNFLYFTDPERSAVGIRQPVVNLEEEQLVQNETTIDTRSIPKLWPLTYQLSSHPNATKMYTQFSSIVRKAARYWKKKRKKTQTVMSNEEDNSSFDENKSSTVNPSLAQTEDVQPINPDGNIDIDETIEFQPPDQSMESNSPFDDDRTEEKIINMGSFSSDSPIDDHQENVTSEQTTDSYLINTTTFSEGRGNLTSSQEAYITTYLTSPSSSDDNLLAKYSKTTNKPDGIYTDDDLIGQEFQTNQTLSTDSLATTFSNDDIQSYLEGRSNLSRSEEEQIEAYLAKQSSLGYALFTKFFETTKEPRIFLPSESESNENTSFSQDLQFQLNRTIDIDGTLFSEDEIQSYLEGRRNLTASQEALIQEYIARQPSSNDPIFSGYSKSAKPATEIFSKYSKATRKPSLSVTPMEDLFTSSSTNGSVPFDEEWQFETYLNRTNNTDEVLFSYEDFKVYLRGNANISVAQETQIQAYLAERSSTPHNRLFNHSTSTEKQILSKYSTSTKKPRRSSIPGQRKENLSLTEDTQFGDYSEELLSTDGLSYDRTTDSNELPFSEDDLRTYVEDRTNLSTSQIIEIQAYLHEQLSSNQSVSSRSLNKTRLLTKIYSKYFNLSTDLEEIFNSEDELQTYIGGRTNLSLTDEEQIRVYLAKETSLGNKTFPRYYRTSTIKPTQMLTFDSEEQIGVSQSDDQIYSTSTEFTSTEPYSTRKPPTQSMSNSTDSFNASMEQSSDIHYDSNEDNTASTDIFNEYSQLSTLTPSSSPLQTSQDIDDYDETIDPSRIPIPRSTSQQPFSTNTESIPLDKSSEPALLYPFATEANHTTIMPSLSIGADQSDPHIDVNQTEIFTHIQSQSNLTDISEYDDDIDNNELQNEISQTYSSPMPVALNVSSTLHPLSPFSTSDTTQSSSHRSPSSTPLHSSPESLSTKSPKSTRPSTFQLISGFASDITAATSSEEVTSIESESTAVLSRSTLFPSSTSTEQSSMQTTDTSPTSTIPEETTTDEPPFTTTSEPPIQTSPTSAPLSTTLELSSTKLSDKTSARSTLTTTEQKYRAFETTEVFTSTSFPSTSKSKILSTLQRIYTSTISTTTTTTTTTTKRRLRTGKQKITRWQTTQQLPTTIVPFYQTTTIPDYRLTTVGTELSPDDKSPLISNDILNQIFQNHSTSTNSSEKSIFFNLIDHPPSTWNLSLSSNESILLNIALPSPHSASYSNSTTNLTFTNIEANRFSTNIIGVPVHLQVDRVQTKRFSLTVNASDDRRNRNGTNEYISDVLIGHVKSEEFQLNLTKSDNMHVHVQQVDSSTAELFLDSNFCTNQSSLEINLNLSKNGTIRYGNRKPIHLGPVFTRVHMLKQSCDRDQPLTLFFDICERENPCTNGGTCLTILPDYNDKSFVPADTGHLGYRCECPLHASGEHCQQLEYPLGYCLNGGTLFQIIDRFNQSMETCLCSRGFRGQHCEENIDDCFGISCSDHGVCEDGIQTYKCSCFDGFYGFHCERTNVQTVLIQAASRSFGVIAILLIAGIAGLVVASDIHTFLTRNQERHSAFHQIPRMTSELFENSVLLLGFSDAPIEMHDLSRAGARKRSAAIKSRQTRRSTRNRRHGSYRQMRKRMALTTFSRPSSRRRFVSRQTIL